MNINKIVQLFEPKQKFNSNYFKDVISRFCAYTGIKNWEQFKRSSRTKTFYARHLKKEITLYGDNVCPRPEYGWSCNEIELVFERSLSTERISRIDKIKEMFGGQLLSG